MLDLKVLVLNVNQGHNPELMEPAIPCGNTRSIRGG